MEKDLLTVNQFIKSIRELFGDVEYKATSLDGKVFKTQGFDKANDKIQVKCKQRK